MSAFFLSFREQIATNFPSIFGEGSDDGFDLRTQFSKKWGWYGAIHQIAKGDILNLDKVTELPMRTCLTFLEFEMDKAEVEKSMMKK